MLELFTSQGCSSCPEADALLSRLGREGGVITLAYHVDYWNDLGWRDPFSHPFWSERQRRYTRQLQSRQLYTPQAVINGRSECLGSDEACIRKALAAAARRAVGIQLEASVALTADRQVHLALKALRTAGIDSRRPLQLLAVFYENGIVTPVGRGENAGRELANDAVVRSLEPLLTLSSAQEIAQKTYLLKLRPHWDLKRTGVVLLLQDPDSMEIITALRPGSLVQ